MKRFVKRTWLIAVHLTALLFVLQIVTAVFGLPPSFVNWMVTGDVVLHKPAQYVIVLGGGGVPSETGLIRCYYAAHFAANAPEAKFIVCLPSDTDPDTSGVGRMRDELVLRGVPADNVLMEHDGRNTREQAVNVRAMLGEDALKKPVRIITSPYHSRRSLLCLRKVGFENVACVAARNTDPEADMGPNTGARYGLWGGLVWQTWHIRELVALAYYWVRGYI